MLLRLLFFAMLVVMVFRFARDLIRRARGRTSIHSNMKAAWEVDESKVKDAEFRDLDG